jgi:hypothetical protein
MTNTIFDLVEEDIPEGKEGFFALAKNAPESKDDSFFNNVSDYAKTFLKGTSEGLSRLGRMMGPLQDYSGKGTHEELEEQTQNLDELLPTEEGFVQKGIRRGLKQLPSVASFPGVGIGIAPRAGIAGFAGQTSEELGAPELVQNLTELTAYIGPNVTKKLLESGNNKALIAAARKFGLSDEAITPLIQPELKQKWLSKISPRRGGTQAALENTKAQLSKSYSSIQNSLPASHKLSKEISHDLVQNIENKLFEMPSGVRGKIKSDFEDLLSKPITGNSLINFWVDINHEVGKNSKQLSLLKEPLKEAMKSISPELSKDFEMINTLYSKYYPIAKRLEPNLRSDIMSIVKPLGLLSSLLTGYYPGILEFGSYAASSKLAQQMLLNPRFQQISKKMIAALDENKFGTAKKLTDLLTHEVKKISPEMAKELETITDEDLQKLFSNHQ